MRCIACDAAEVSEWPERTAQGYRQFRCRACGKKFFPASAPRHSFLRRVPAAVDILEMA